MFLKGADPKKKQLRSILIRLLTRGCQVTDEIICLLENGFADGAMARWRTLHEIADIAKRYVDHQAVESKRKLDKYLACYKDFGYKPLRHAHSRKSKKPTTQPLRAMGKPSNRIMAGQHST